MNKTVNTTINLTGSDIIELIKKEYPGMSFKGGKKALEAISVKLWKSEKEGFEEVDSSELKVGDKVKVISFKYTKSRFGLVSEMKQEANKEEFIRSIHGTEVRLDDDFSYDIRDLKKVK